MKPKVFLSTILVCTVAYIFAMCAASATAQTGLDRTVLPIPEPQYPHITVLDVRNAKAPPRFEVKAPARAPERAHRADRRHGLRPVERLRRPDPHADGGAPGRRRAALQPVPHHGALLADPRGAADRPQPSHVQHGLDHGDGHGLPRADRAAPEQRGPAGRDAAAQRLTATAAFGKSHETAAWEVSPSGPTDRWPTRSGFDKFYGFIGGETNQWAPPLYDGMTQVEPPKDPNYHFMTDMTNQAIAWMQGGEVAHAGQAVLHLLRPGRHARAAPRAQGMDRQVQGQVRPGLGQAPRRDAGPAEALGVVPPDTKLAPKPAAIKDWDNAERRREEALRPPDGGLRRLRRVRRLRDRPAGPGHRGHGPDWTTRSSSTSSATTAPAPKAA